MRCVRHWWMFGLVIFAGCAGLRTPSLAARSPRVERRMYELHDPFPAESSGPTTFTRPRDFRFQRTDTQRDRDLRMLRSQQLPPGTAPLPSAPSFGSPTQPGPALPPPTYAPE